MKFVSSFMNKIQVNNSKLKMILLTGASVVLREKAGRTPLELALEIRDGASQGQETLTVPRGDMDLTVELLVDAESKDTQAAREKIQKLPGNWSTSRPYQKLLAAAATGNLTELPPFLQTDPSTSSALTKKTLRAIALGNALSGMGWMSLRLGNGFFIVLDLSLQMILEKKISCSSWVGILLSRVNLLFSIRLVILLLPRICHLHVQDCQSCS